MPMGMALRRRPGDALEPRARTDAHAGAAVLVEDEDGGGLGPRGRVYRGTTHLRKKATLASPSALRPPPVLPCASWALPERVQGGGAVAEAGVREGLVGVRLDELGALGAAFAGHGGHGGSRTCPGPRQLSNPMSAPPHQPPADHPQPAAAAKHSIAPPVRRWPAL